MYGNNALQENAMANVYFRVAGMKKHNDLNVVFLQSQNRLKSLNDSIYHRNDFTTQLQIPQSEFKKNFQFERSSGIYRTKLTWKDVHKKLWITTIAHI
jgi:hypothetical protein